MKIQRLQEHLKENTKIIGTLKGKYKDYRKTTKIIGKLQRLQENCKDYRKLQRLQETITIIRKLQRLQEHLKENYKDYRNT